MLDHVPLGQPPSLPLLRRSLRATLVRRLRWYSGAVRLPVPVHHGRAPWVHRADLARVPGQVQGLPGSAHSVSVHARGLRPRQVCPPLAVTVCAVWPAACSERVGTQDWPISGRNPLPAPSPVNASCVPLPIDTHDSGPVWLARPSLSGTCTLHHSAGLSQRLPERRASGAPGSRSEARAEAGGRRLHPPCPHGQPPRQKQGRTTPPP